MGLRPWVMGSTRLVLGCTWCSCAGLDWAEDSRAHGEHCNVHNRRVLLLAQSCYSAFESRGAFLQPSHIQWLSGLNKWLHPAYFPVPCHMWRDFLPSPVHQWCHFLHLMFTSDILFDVPISILLVASCSPSQVYKRRHFPLSHLPQWRLFLQFTSTGDVMFSISVPHIYICIFPA